MADEWGEALERAKETRVGAINFLNKPEARQMLLAWPLVPLEVVIPDDPGPAPHPDAPAVEHRAWCWQFVRYDPIDWARLSDVPRPECEALGVVLTEHGLVFPDGTVYDQGEKYCNAIAARQIVKETGGKPRG